MTLNQDRFTRMCDHPLIQKGREPKVGDWVSCLFQEGTVPERYRYVCLWESWMSVKYEGLIYLLSMTDLWAMLPVPYALAKFKCSITGQTLFCVEAKRNKDKTHFYKEAKTAQEALIQGVFWEREGLKWSDEKGWV